MQVALLSWLTSDFSVTLMPYGNISFSDGILLPWGELRLWPLLIFQAMRSKIVVNLQCNFGTYFIAKLAPFECAFAMLGRD